MKGYQLKVTIKGSKPPIWRRILVPESITFSDLDEVLECIFGWEHEHLYDFRIPGEDLSFIPEPDSPEDEDARTETIDAWMWEGAKLVYTYDFGDWWEHTVLVEKIVEYQNRYATVIKSKGPYMIEDCGGIWGFYERMDEAEPFNLDQANKALEAMKFRKHPAKQQSGRGGQQLIEEIGGIAESYLKNLQLEEVFCSYKKSNLITLAQVHGFTKYSKFNKTELAKWLKNHLLETKYMAEVIEYASEDEIELFEDAMDDPEGIWAVQELVSTSVLLCSYAAYLTEGRLVVPADVRERYQQLSTPALRKRRETSWELLKYYRACVYLYGVLPVKKFIEIYRHYEKVSLTEQDVKDQVLVYEDQGELFTQVGDLIMDEELSEADLYKQLLSVQGKLAYYLPEDKEAFLSYGKLECQEPDETTEPFLEYLQTKMKVEYPHSLIAFYMFQEAVRGNKGIEEMLSDFIELAGSDKIKISSQKKFKEVVDQIRKFSRQVRIWELRGFTQAEISGHQEKQRQAHVVQRSGTNKIIPFPVEKKNYPNDPCPCGSGKKYKHCCGKNKK